MVAAPKYGSTEEAQVLEEFKSLVSDLGQNEAICLRFLRARNHDKTKAEDMLRKSLEWRAKHQLDDCKNWKIPEEIPKQFNFLCTEKDYKGQIVVYLPVGKWPTVEFFEAGLKEGMEKNCLRQFESVNIMRMENDQPLLYFIVDVDGLGYRTCINFEVQQTARKILRWFESYYPEIVAKIVIINAHWAFYYFYPIVKQLMSGNTFSKITVYNSNVDKWQAALLKDIPADSLRKLCYPSIP